MREITLDTETTGLDPVSGHRIVEIGCVEMMNKVRTGKTFHVYLNPERDMPEEAKAIHGLSFDFLADKPKFADIAADFVAFLGDSPLVIHNAGFDMKFINHELVKAGCKAVEMARAVDTLMLARKKFPGSPSSLDALCRRYEIDNSSRTYHGALLDAELLAEVYLELCGGRQASIFLDQTPGSSLQAVQETVTVRVDIAYRRFEISAEERAAHAALIETLKNPIWNEDAVIPA